MFKQRTQIYSMYNRCGNYLITVPIYQSKAEEIGEAFDRTFCDEILCSRLHNNGPGQHIYVISYKLFIQ